MPRKYRKISSKNTATYEVDDEPFDDECDCERKRKRKTGNKIHIKHRRNKLYHLEKNEVAVYTNFHVCYNEEPAESNEKIAESFQIVRNVPSLKSIAIASLLNERKYAKNDKTLHFVKKAMLWNSDVLLYKMRKVGSHVFDGLELTKLYKANVGEKFQHFQLCKECSEEYYFPAGEESLIYKHNQPIPDLS
uniref:Icos protein n=1 Tax=Fopius arisanus TaxID=64838 RepID=A0A0C9QEI1_9HYME